MINLVFSFKQFDWLSTFKLSGDIDEFDLCGKIAVSKTDIHTYTHIYSYIHTYTNFILTQIDRVAY